jgi:hypothetical protein
MWSSEELERADPRVQRSPLLLADAHAIRELTRSGRRLDVASKLILSALLRSIDKRSSGGSVRSLVIAICLVPKTLNYRFDP